jgi:toxin-antitoxin system PIN domain toxin
VIAVDSNILVYAHRAETQFHGAAVTALKTLAEGTSPWAIPWPCLHEFYSVVTHLRVYDPPSSAEEALRQIDVWLEAPTLVLLAESDQHWSELRALVIASKITGPRIHDARIAVLCRQHGVRELWSADRDFSRFPTLTVVNPLTR